MSASMSTVASKLDQLDTSFQSFRAAMDEISEIIEEQKDKELTEDAIVERAR